MSIELELARRKMIDQVVDFNSGVACAHIFIRTAAPGAELLDRLTDLGIRTQVKEHFDRLNAEPDFDQAFAHERILQTRKAGGLLFLTGPAGSGKTEVFLQYLKASTALGEGIVVTASTNQARNVLRARGALDALTFHQAIYGKPAFNEAHIAEGIAFFLSDGKVELSPAISPQLASAWRSATPGARERAAREVAGVYAGEQQLAKALGMIGIGQGLMAVIKPIWNAGQDSEPAAMFAIDEASMLRDDDIAIAREKAASMLLIGDQFQLPPVIDSNDQLAGRRPALSTVPLSDQVHLWRDRRVKGSSEHLQAARQMLSEQYGLNDLLGWGRTGKYRGLTLHDSYDGMKLIKAPVLSYYKKTVRRVAIAWRQAVGLPEDGLVPGERLLIEVVPRDLRDELAAKSIGKNTRVVVIEQPSQWQVVVIAESVFDRLIAEGAKAEVIRDHSIALALRVEYPAFELQDSGVRMTEAMALGGLILAKGQAVTASLAAASTTHKAQGGAYPTAIVMMDDMFGYARSYGRDVLDDLPIPLWRRVIYTALTRGIENVELVFEGSSQRTMGAKLRNIPTEADIRATLPETVRPDPYAELVADLQELDSDEDAAKQNNDTTIADPPTASLAWQEPYSNVMHLRRRIEAPKPPPVDDTLPMLDPGLAAFAAALMGKTQRMMLPAGDGSGYTLELGRNNMTGGARMRILSPGASPQYWQWEDIIPGRPSRWGFKAFDLEVAEQALRRYRDNPHEAFRGMVTCGVCGRALEDPVSKALGIGPVCAGRLGIPFEMPADRSPRTANEVP